MNKKNYIIKIFLLIYFFCFISIECNANSLPISLEVNLKLKPFYYGDLAISFDINDKIIIENASIQTIIHPNFESISDTDLQEIT